MFPGVLGYELTCYKYPMVLPIVLEVVGISLRVTWSVRDRSLHHGVTQSFKGRRDKYKCYLEC